MNRQEFHDVLASTGITVRYGQGEKGLRLPFMAYTFVRGSLLDADNKTYATKNVATIELLTTSKQEQDELSGMLEEALTSNDIPFGLPDEGWDDANRFYQLTYNLEV